jgi:glycosyltransferase involved in cell wall biosynthesis
MRIHLYSRAFAPAVGGMEMLMELLAREFHRLGHAVEVVTETAGVANLPFPVHRRPGFAEYRRIARAADVVLTAPLSLRRLIPQVLAGRPVVAVHPILWPDRGGARLATWLKRIVAKRLTNIVPSRFMARHFPDPAIIGNPYDAATFVWPDEPARRDLVLFVGRLVPEKGCDLMLRALAQVDPARLTIVGDGPERPALTQLASALGIADRVDFLGSMSGDRLAKAMREHGTMVVPTVCEEAFGIVALEGLASGCRMIVARSGGLPEAVGACGLIFDRGDQVALADSLRLALGPDDRRPARTEVARHLEQFTPVRVAEEYLAVLATVTNRNAVSSTG